MTHTFKTDYLEADRIKECKDIIKKFPNRIPIIIKVQNGYTFFSKDKLPVLDKTKYLVPDNCTVVQFMLVLRKRLKVPETVGLYLLVDKDDGKAVSTIGTDLISKFYNEYKSSDGFLYMTISAENAFGF